MSSLWLVPLDEDSFQNTIASPIDLSEQDEKPADFPEEARVWGVRTDEEQGDWKRNRNYLEKMEEGDPIIFYRNELSTYYATGKVGPMWHTEYVRDEYWGGGPALDVFVVEDYNDSLDLQNETINDLLGYELSFHPNGLWRVSDDQPVDRVLRCLNLD